MALNKLKNGLLLVMALVVVGLGIGLLGNRPATAEPPDRKKEEPTRPAPAPAGVGAEPKAAVKIPEAVRPIGVWEKTIAMKDLSATITLRIEPNTIELTIKQSAGKESFKIILEGEYSVAHDYTLYGIVTSVDMNPTGDVGGAEGVAELADQPFSVRYRFDGETLTLRDLKLGGIKKEETKESALFLGRFKKKGKATERADSD